MTTRLTSVRPTVTMGRIGSAVDCSLAPGHGFTGRTDFMAMWIIATILAMAMLVRCPSVEPNHLLTSSQMKRGTATVMPEPPAIVPPQSIAVGIRVVMAAAVAGAVMVAGAVTTRETRENRERLLWQDFLLRKPALAFVAPFTTFAAVVLIGWLTNGRSATPFRRPFLMAGGREGL